MGLTSTNPGLEELKAQYEALADKRSVEGRELRERIKELEKDTVVGPVDHDSILPDLSRVADRERKAVYWLGVIPGNHKDWTNMPPCHQIDGIGGRITFTEWWTPHEGAGQDGTPRRGQYPGQLVELTESQVAEIRRGLRQSIVRWHVGPGRRQPYGFVVRIPGLDSIAELKERFGLNDKEIARLRVKAEQFQLRDTDEPVARYIYMQKVSGPEAVPGGKWRPSTTLPPSVEKVGHIEGP